MLENYIGFKSGEPIDLTRDGCSLADWLAGNSEEAEFALHPKGFPVFLRPESIGMNDEYSEGDPYAVEETLDNAFHRRRIGVTLELVREACEGNEAPKIVDIGCGKGFLTEHVRQSNNDAQCSGLDHSVSAIAYAHDRFPRIDFAVGDAYTPPYQSASFDVVILNNIYEHVTDPVRLLAAAHRVLKPGGY
ncbi:MAG: methyltransferase domain-containing protein [Verrucomicrobia bacterium]|jgi:SAM-dependent methyltransferase|nr:methyltransferase domain-containing protein [Verrucomicrobiota bacterium]